MPGETQVQTPFQTQTNKRNEWLERMIAKAMKLEYICKRFGGCTREELLELLTILADIAPAGNVIAREFARTYEAIVFNLRHGPCDELMEDMVKKLFRLAFDYAETIGLEFAGRIADLKVNANNYYIYTTLKKAMVWAIIDSLLLCLETRMRRILQTLRI